MRTRPRIAVLLATALFVFAACSSGGGTAAPAAPSEGAPSAGAASEAPASAASGGEPVTIEWWHINNNDPGKSLWQERASSVGPKSSSWSSMVLAGDKIYVMNQSSDTIVMKAAPKYEVISVNSVGNELSNSSHALSDGEIFIRTHKHLWCIGETRTASR